MVDPVINVAIVIGVTEFIKKLLVRVNGPVLRADLTMVVAGIIGAVLAFAAGEVVLQGVLLGAAAVGGVTTVRNLGGKG